MGYAIWDGERELKVMKFKGSTLPVPNSTLWYDLQPYIKTYFSKNQFNIILNYFFGFQVARFEKVAPSNKDDA
jgi:hypothetical protein